MPANDFIERATFDREDFTIRSLPTGEYEACTFGACDFSGGDLSGSTFTDCIFNHCNLSNVAVVKTTFSKAAFRDCKMLGLRFDTCNPFGLSFSFTGCTLNLSSFYGRKISKTVFRNCVLQEADFTDTDLSGSILENCDLSGATFDNTSLGKADLRGSHSFSIDPERNGIKKAKFSLSALDGLLHRHHLVIDRKS